jgi:hypothetical protein
MKRQSRPTYSIPADLAWAAAYAAWRLNGNLYLKAVYDANKGMQTMQTNKEIMMRILTETPEEITDSDREQGSLCRGRLGSEISLRLLKGETLTEWHVLQARICNTETFETAYDLAVLASFPKSYSKIRSEDQIQERLNQCEDSWYDQGRQRLIVEVVRSIYSAKWNTWYVWGIDADNHAVRFAYREQIKPGRTVEIAGTVAGNKDRTTILKRVRVMEEEVVA